MDEIIISLKRVGGEDTPIPIHATSGSAGIDLSCWGEEITLKPGERALLPTGIAVALPEGYEAQIRPRSGIAIQHGITLLNSPGTIDSDSRGEIKLIIINHGHEPFTIRRGDRIAQMVIAKVAKATFQVVETLPPSTRGEGGFGSSSKGG